MDAATHEATQNLAVRRKRGEGLHLPSLSISLDVNAQRDAISNGGTIVVTVTNNGNAAARQAFVEVGWAMLFGRQPGAAAYTVEEALRVNAIRS